ncbi:hypothetical protein HNR23_000874 [Nocardiopsis mwathae]|uniref:DUF4192 domain-containing protein n=1 Tax=Nocardiopsis mwathae TaxID=1472723 RepID=A0A7W9YER2_9ACTN|nr:DUF4192 domain-containing protein [Nocardiopsis mwathae]MBB6170814.1 hypothetical protein [Nocardiopsis mwathae]
MAHDDGPHLSSFTDPPTLTIGGPTDVIAAVPYLLGFHPADCLVILGLRPGAARLRCVLRCDLADRPPDLPAQWGRQVAALLAEAGCANVIAVGYGPAHRITPLVDALRAHAPAAGVPVREALRVVGGRYWSYVCSAPECCPPDGVAYDVGTSTVPATAVVGGLTAWRDRRLIEEFVAPVGGPRSTEMRRATAQAEARAARLRRHASDLGPTAVRTALRVEGVRAVHAAVGAARDGRLVDDPEAIAWLGLVLASVRVRDEAWALIDAEHIDTHVGLWRHVFRHVGPEYAAAPGALLAFAAWQSGDTALADVALDRVEESAPHYTMAALVRQAVRGGMPPEKWEPMSTEWLERVAPLAGPDGPTALPEAVEQTGAAGTTGTGADDANPP